MILKKKNDLKRRVVVTGLGVISSIGIGVEEFWKNLIAGKSGITEIESFDTSAYPVHKGGEVKNFRPEDFIDRRKLKHLGRASQMAIAATKMAIEDAKLKKPDIRKAGILMGTTLGESPLIERMNESLAKDDFEGIDEANVFLYPTNSIPVNVALEFGAGGYNAIFPTACASGNYAIGYGFDLIRTGQADIVFAGASDAFSRIAFTGFNRLMAMAPEMCQPFDKNRRGMMLGEGAGVLVLESLDHGYKRKARIYNEILGYGLSCDAHHMTQPTVCGVIDSIEIALKEAKVSIDEVGYISLHGTGTEQNDKVESSAIITIFTKKRKLIPCSSIKSMLGHSMGAASALEALSCSLALKHGIAPPTTNYYTPDPQCQIDCVPNKAKVIPARVAMNNSYAFGGNNAVLVFSIFT